MTVEYRMARGFESKDVEYQQAERERAQALGRRRDEQRACRRRTAIELSLARMRADLTKARRSRIDDDRARDCNARGGTRVSL